MTTVLVLVIVLALAAAVFDYQPLWQKISGFRPWTLGLDLSGGSYLVYQIDLSQVESGEHESVVAGLRDVIERRVNLFGVSEPKVYTENIAGQNRLIVELAGIKEVSEAIKEIGETPFLDFREVAEDKIATSALIFIPTALTGRYVKTARVDREQLTNKFTVNIEFNKEGSDIFEILTAKNVSKPLAIFLDNQLIEMPVVQEKIVGGRAQISGNFTLESAKKLTERFNAGALPAPITLVNQQTVSAELGGDSLNKALAAGLVGTILILLFMILYYKRLGFFASVALLMYIALTLAIFKIVPVIMTLAGVAGFILSIGMAVDANILVFERTKEELKKGLSRKAAVEEGFRRAWTSIRDSNISTLISAFVLYYFTSSFVRGFALTLFLGVMMSMFSAIIITRTLLRLFLKEPKLQN